MTLCIDPSVAEPQVLDYPNWSVPAGRESLVGVSFLIASAISPERQLFFSFLKDVFISFMALPPPVGFLCRLRWAPSGCGVRAPASGFSAEARALEAEARGLLGGGARARLSRGLWDPRPEDPPGLLPWPADSRPR